MLHRERLDGRDWVDDALPCGQGRLDRREVLGEGSGREPVAGQLPGQLAQIAGKTIAADDVSAVLGLIGRDLTATSLVVDAIGWASSSILRRASGARASAAMWPASRRPR